MRRVLPLLFLLALAATACGQPLASPAVAMRVDDEQVTLDDVGDLLALAEQDFVAQGQPAPPDLAAQILDQLAITIVLEEEVADVAPPQPAEDQDPLLALQERTSAVIDELFARYEAEVEVTDDDVQALYDEVAATQELPPLEDIADQVRQQLVSDQVTQRLTEELTTALQDVDGYVNPRFGRWQPQGLTAVVPADVLEPLTPAGATDAGAGGLEDLLAPPPSPAQP